MMRYRNAIKDDIPQLVDMRISYLNEENNGLNQNQISQLLDKLPLYFQKHLGRDLKIYICELHSEIISTVFMLLSEKPPRPSFLSGRTGTFLNVYTRPVYRRQGIAGELLKIAISEAKKLNLSFIDIDATQDGHRLYSHIGFKEKKTKYIPMRLTLTK